MNNYLKINLLLYFCFISTSCSSIHYYLRLGDNVVSATNLYSMFNKGIKIINSHKDTITNSDSLLYIKLNNSDSCVIFLKFIKSSDKLCLNDTLSVILEMQKPLFIDNTLWIEKTKFHDIDTTVHWYFHDINYVKTISKNYLLITLTTSVYYLRTTYYVLLIEITPQGNLLKYILPPHFYEDYGFIGDFNTDGNLDYAYLNESQKKIEYYTFLNNDVYKSDGIFLNIKDCKAPMHYFPLYRIKHIQNNSSWWHDGNFPISVFPK